MRAFGLLALVVGCSSFNHGYPDAGDAASADVAVMDVGTDVAVVDTGGDVGTTDVPGDRGAGDSGVDTGVDAAPDGVTDVAVRTDTADGTDLTDSGTDCGAGESLCGTRCTRTQTDVANCGGCGMACGAVANGTASCVAGSCGIAACAAGFADCDGNVRTGCETATTTAANCGGCGRACMAGTACAVTGTSAMCAACGATGLACCGGAGGTCAAGNNCTGGTCAACGGNGQSCCGGAVCGSPLSCVGGTSCGCAGGQSFCGGACVSTASDVANCGGCGRACAAGQTCTAGACSAIAVCPTGMVRIPGGTFTMGASDLGSDTTPHMVTLTRPYCLDVTEVTVAAYRSCTAAGCTAPVTGGSCNWMVGGRDNHPINCVDWNQSRAYCQWVHGGGGDLPTEAQWEYAARGAMTEPVYPWGMQAPDDSRLCWNGGSESNSGTCTVGRFPAGVFGLFDMAGNVWEWTGDCYAAYSSGGLVDPTGPTGSCTNRVFRGGSWSFTAAALVRAAFRNWDAPTYQNDNVGFRCARGL